jgi:uncharacterized protein YprB with RNaseH-like and TPR domain
MKIAFLDIETTRLVADNGLGFILCCSMKIWHEKKIKTVRIDASKDYKKCLYNDTFVVDGIADWLIKEDPEVIVTYNGDFFDIPYINTRRLGANKKPLPPCRYMDHFKTSRYNLKLHSMGLNAMAEHLGVVHHKTRFEPIVWQRAMFGSKPDLDKIVHHCELDIVVLEECHDKVLPVLRKLKGVL